MESSKSPNKAIIAIIVIVLLVAAATAAIVVTNKPAEDNVANTSDLPAQTSAPSDTVVAADDVAFKDGTYRSTGEYQTPGGMEKIGVEVTLADGVVIDAKVTEQGKTGEAQEYQGRFVSGFKSQVVGKKISDIELDRVSGSSLTSSGFNAAIDDIEKRAQV